jgi:hypothetical protein
MWFLYDIEILHVLRVVELVEFGTYHFEFPRVFVKVQEPFHSKLANPISSRIFQTRENRNLSGYFNSRIQSARQKFLAMLWILFPLS